MGVLICFPSFSIESFIMFLVCGEFEYFPSQDILGKVSRLAQEKINTSYWY